MTPATMQVARLHGVGDLRIEELPVPEPGPDELLIKVEACGVCPTDARKFDLGLNHGDYPLNPGHEWVGRVVASGGGTARLVGRRVYGDTYGGYAEYATIAVGANGWSFGALPLDDELPVERAVFVEPLADCLHAVHDQARLGVDQTAVVVGAGSMGLQLIGTAALAGARVLAIEPRADRRELALEFGATSALGTDDWVRTARREADEIDALILSIGQAALVQSAIECVRTGGRVVLFAGFGDSPRATLDLNDLHYREISLVGSEWIGVPPRVRLERYEQAHDLLVNAALPIQRLVSARCDFAGLETVLREVREQRQLKAILIPGAAV